MSAHRYQSAWRSITFNRIFKTANEATVGPDDPDRLDPAFQSSDYRLSLLNISEVQTVDYRELKQHLEGAEANEAFEGVRFLQGEGTILASSPADLEDKTWAMYEAFSPASCRVAFASADPPGTGVFTFKRDSAGGAKALQFLARPAVGRPVIVGRAREGLSRPFRFALVALDPFAYSQTETQTVVALGGGTATNNGNIYSQGKIRITMSGAGHAAFTITNSTTGKAMVLDLSGASASQVYIIDVRRGRITLESDGSNQYAKRVSGFAVDMWLAAGANTIAFANTTGITSVRFDARDAYA